ncbi:unnamed protein product, partial [Rotaria sp. Silwood1]
YTVPPSDTTYHCKIFKASTHFSTKRHAIAREILVDKNNRDLVHHMLMFECDPSIVSDDNDLSNDLCDNLLQQLQPCFANSATGWVVGDLQQLLLSIKWTPVLAEQWQEFYNNATRLVVYGRAEYLDSVTLQSLPKFENLNSVEYRKEPIVNHVTSTTIDFNLNNRIKTVTLAFIPYL